MSRRASSNVRGPTSALTEFLRERGITARNTNRFARRNDAEQAQADTQPGTPGTDASSVAQGDASSSSGAAVASSSASPSPAPVNGGTSSSTSSTAGVRRRTANTSASMRFDEDTDSELSGEEEAGGEQGEGASAEAGPSTAVAGTSAGTKRKRAAADKKEAAKKKAAKDAGLGDGDEDEDEEGGFFSNLAGPSTSSSRSAHSYQNKTPGSIDYCAMCKAKFTITKYTKATPKGPLCHKCAPLYKPGEGDADGDFDLPPAPKKKPKQRARRVLPTIDANWRSIPTLQTLCINIISDYIEDVEALGGISNQAMDDLSKSISKNRSLNPRTMQLFLEPHTTDLSLYDCSRLDSEALQNLPTFAPNLEKLNLQLCGCLDNAAMDEWTAKLKKLHTLELYGPFLVRFEAWHRFFAEVGERLRSFKIRESPRFDMGCIEKMVECCPNITELGLAQIGPLDDAALKSLHAYTALTYLDISDPGVSAPGVPPKSLTDDGIIPLLTAVGGTLEHLDVSKNADVTDNLLLTGLKPHCKRLRVLRLSHCVELNTDAVAKLFTDWTNTNGGLTRIDLERCVKLEDNAIKALVAHSGGNLAQLNLNSVDNITAEGLSAIANGCPNLEDLDLGFCRAMDDATIMSFVEKLPKLRVVRVFGCNRVSDFVRSDRVRIIGKEKDAPQ